LSCATFQQCVFNDSQAIFDSGGAVYNDFTAVTAITNSNFYTNKAASGAAIASQGQLSLKDCVIDSNTASLIGGGVYMISAALATSSNDSAEVVYTNVSITSTNITNNKCTERAGVVYIEDYINAIISQVNHRCV
jgi:hypothetical protein